MIIWYKLLQRSCGAVSNISFLTNFSCKCGTKWRFGEGDTIYPISNVWCHFLWSFIIKWLIKSYTLHPAQWSAIIITCKNLICYASAFRRRRHYVFGLSVRLSIRPSVRSLKYPLLTCTWVRWSTRPTLTVLRHVRPSVHPSLCPSGEVSGHLPENAWQEWPEILHADVYWPSSELISSWLWSVNFSNFGAILT